MARGAAGPGGRGGRGGNAKDKHRGFGRPPKGAWAWRHPKEGFERKPAPLPKGRRGRPDLSMRELANVKLPKGWRHHKGPFKVGKHGGKILKSKSYTGGKGFGRGKTKGEPNLGIRQKRNKLARAVATGVKWSGVGLQDTHQQAAAGMVSSGGHQQMATAGMVSSGGMSAGLGSRAGHQASGTAVATEIKPGQSGYGVGPGHYVRRHVGGPMGAEVRVWVPDPARIPPGRYKRPRKRPTKLGTRWA